MAADGSISVTTVDGSAIAGQVGIFGFPDGSELSSLGGNRFAAPPGIAATPVQSVVEQGAIEGANLDAVHGTMQLILVQRQAEMMQKALSVFHNDFDKTASEDLGRV